MTLRLDIAILGTPDVSAAQDFYSAAFAPSVQDYGGFSRLGLHGTGGLGLSGSASLAAEAGLSAEGSGFQHLVLSHDAASQEEVDGPFEKAETAGARVTAAPAPQEWGGCIGHFTDPAGVAWKIAAAE